MAQNGLVGIEGIDTRALTRALREEGAMRGAVSTEVRDAEALIERVKASPQMKGQNLVPDVTCAEPYTWDTPSWRAADAGEFELPAADLHVIAYDFGIKHNILRDLRTLGCRVTVVPASTPAKDILGKRADGYFLSNGPGDPAAVTSAIDNVKDLLEADVTVFGICLGHQILSLALGAKTFKLPFGHHGANHPVQDLETGRVEITSQNHGFAVDADTLPDGVTLTHKNLYDNTVEGIRVDSRPVFGVQYHPESSPGPHDSSYLFRRFVATMRGE
jgi:carbamoyl-phosphate synthase small subunit